MTLPIRTHQKRIPWLWAFMIGLPWVTFEYTEKVSQAPLTFTLRKFIEDPVAISFIISINILFNFMVGVSAAYISDRIWTPVGRRKPFFIVSCLLAGVLTIMIPIVGYLWLLIVVVVLFQFFVDFNKPWEPLFNEVIPPQQRGRAGMLRMLSVNLASLFLTGVLIAQFDSVYEIPTPVGEWIISGEQVLYWSVALVLFSTAAFLTFGIREEKPVSVDPKTGMMEGYRKGLIPGTLWKGDRDKSGVALMLKGLFKDIFSSRQKIWVYLLYICPLAGTMAVSHPSYITMLTDQIGLSKAEYGRMNFISMVCMIAIFTPIAGVLADRMCRLVMMRVGILGVAIVQGSFFIYLNFVNEGQASYELVVAIDIVTKLCLSWVWAVWSPLVYDYIPSNEMGTFQAGIMFTSGVASFILINLGGQWVSLWTKIFGTGYSPTNYDQSSVLAMAFCTGLAALIPVFLFARNENRGVIRPLGKLEERD